jgi:hypothetical protein
MRMLDSNVRALGARYPDYADLVTALAPSGAWRLELKEPGVVLCQSAEGAWIHGPGNPWHAARHDAQALAALSPRLYVLIRPGLGYQALALVRELGAREPGSVVVIAEDRLDLWRAGLEHLDWREALRFRGTVLRLGDPYRVVEALLQQHPSLHALPVTLVAPEAEASDSKCLALGKRLDDAAEAFRTEIEGKYTAATRLLADRRRRQDPPRILLAGQEVGYLAQPLRSGFEASGCEVVSWDFDRRTTPRDVLAADSLPALLDYLPDVVLWINQPELSSIAHRAARGLGIVSVLWSVDTPRRVGLARSDFSLVDLHLSFDPNCVEPRVPCHAQLSVGAGLAPLPGCRPEEAVWPKRQGPDVSFVGSYGEARIRELRAELGREHSERLDLLDRLAAGSDDPGPEFEAATGSRYQRSSCAYVDEVRTMRRRAAVLRELPKGSLQIFGSTEWQRAGGLAECYGGRTVHYGMDLASLYFHSKINLNIFHEQCTDSTNSRVYDVLAAGGFLLTEYRPCLDREFQVGRHLATFSTPAEAREKVEYYLAHEDEREAIAREGQRHVLAHHTFAHRCRRMLELALPLCASEPAKHA